MRERMILIAYRREIADTVTFPQPTHFIELPPGYEGTRSVALKYLSFLDDVLVAAGCGMLIYAASFLGPMAGWFVAGVICIGGGIVIGVAGRSK